MEEVSTLYNEALADFRQNQLDLAVQKLSQVLALDPSFDDAYEALSVILYNQKKYDDAIGWLKKWMALNPDSIMAHTNLSRCYVAKEMIPEAEKEQAEARRLTWKAELKSKKQQMPTINYEQQIERFKQVIALDPKDVLGYFSLATAYLDSGNPRDAADIFEKAVKVEPKHSSSYLGFGLALEQLGDREKAKQIYVQGIRVADEAGDIIPLRKMESRLRILEESG